MKRVVVALVLVSVAAGLIVGPAPAQRYRLRALRGEQDFQLLSSKTWASFKHFGAEDEYRLKIAYLRGFFDALQYAQVAPWRAKNVFVALKGQDLNAIVTKINDFYAQYPQHRQYTPATVILIVLPRLKKGLPPVPGP
ncbi:MAG: hypothetical protein KKC37_02650 [Proteobacteria bacterium]|nr:hypothetical protein [Pseudomonadota bacterium]